MYRKTYLAARCVEGNKIETSGQVSAPGRNSRNERPPRRGRASHTAGRNSEQRDEKLASYCKLIRNLEARANVRQAEADTFRQEANRLDALAEADLKAVEKLKERLKWFWQAHDLGKIEAGGFRINLQANGGVAPVQFTDDTKPEDADERFHKVIPARVDWDKDAVRKALQAGEELMFAKLGERGYRIVIK